MSSRFATSRVRWSHWSLDRREQLVAGRSTESDAGASLSVVTAALIDASGVRRSWETAPTSALRQRSTSSSSSVRSACSRSWLRSMASAAWFANVPSSSRSNGSSDAPATTSWPTGRCSAVSATRLTSLPAPTSVMRLGRPGRSERRGRAPRRSSARRPSPRSRARRRRGAGRATQRRGERLVARCVATSESSSASDCSPIRCSETHEQPARGGLAAAASLRASCWIATSLVTTRTTTR